MKLEELGAFVKQEDFDSLFRRMGWDNPGALESVRVPDSDLVPVAVADKRGVTAWLVDCPSGLPQRSEQHRVVRRLKRFSRDQLVVFVAPDRHLWLWPEQQPSGVGDRLVGHGYTAKAPTDALLQRLARASFSLDEEDNLTATSVLARVRQSFNADKVTKSFYKEFQKHHKNFAMKVEGISTPKDRRWYASVLLNRLMFIYFIQQKRFLDNNQNYLRSRLEAIREYYGADQFYAFYREFLLPLFHEGLGSPNPNYEDAEIKRIIGNVPYVDGGIFELHDLEQIYDIDIKDEAFESLFDFFDAWRWHLDEKLTGEPNEINADILGFIFEQYINFTEKGQKEKGAYYTKPDVTGYMAGSTILPALADRFVAAGLDDPCILLSGSGDTYIHDSILHGVDIALPDGWDTAGQNPSEELALPGERWCDVTHRRERCARLRGLLSDGSRGWKIDDGISENLDMREMLADYLVLLSTADECDKAFNVLQSLTVCDPTVGSGAFLFAALEVLDPLYGAVLGRAAELHDRDGDIVIAACLQDARRHPSERYWMLKTLCLNNLYGVDLMEEAPEIAKLRLFLKLAAQIDNVELVEPLPDLDFNIKTGNLLVGIADAGDAEVRLGAGRLDLGGELAKIKAVADQVAQAHDAFADDQSRDLGKSDHTSAKQTLIAQLDAARSLADTLLHKQRVEVQTFERWRDSHQPFHWFVEFPTVWRNGGFDVIIGNPPYVNSQSVTGYRWIGYKTQSSRDLYAPCMERASVLVNSLGRMGLIVMHSLCFGKSYNPLRRHLLERFGSLWVSSYWGGRSGLFAGSAGVRNSIVISSRSPDTSALRTCRYMRWLADGRDLIFPAIEYATPEPDLMSCGSTVQWPFIGSATLARAFSHMVRNNSPIGTVLAMNGEHTLYYKKTALYMLGVSVDPTPLIDSDGTELCSPHDGTLRFVSEVHRDLALITLVGRWAYLWWLTFGDEFNVTKNTLAAFPGNVDCLAAVLESNASGVPPESIQRLSKLLELSRCLKTEMPEHRAWMVKAGKNVGRFDMTKLRHITDESDLLLSELWNVENAYAAAGNIRDRMSFEGKG